MKQIPLNTDVDGNCRQYIYKGNKQAGRIYSKDGICPTLTAMEGGNTEPKIIERDTPMKGNYEEPGICTLDKKHRIRKLTPRECFRLMGVSESDIDKIQQSGVSQTQQYKMAGNSIVVDCLYHLFRKMFTETDSENRQLTLF